MNTIENRAPQEQAQAQAQAEPMQPSERLWGPACKLFFLLTLLTGLVYPVAVTGMARLFFPDQAAGSLVRVDGVVVGSSLMGQSFTDPRHFWGRPSATSPQVYNAANSSGSNLGPSNPALLDAVKDRMQALMAADPAASGPIPVDLVTASGSGLDPEISLAAANYQVPRVARLRGLPPQHVQAVVDQLAQHPWMGWWGEPRVNVLALNLALDRQWPLR